LPEGNKPRYTMIVEAVKAGYNKWNTLNFSSVR
jgi:hypothetical protein